MRYIADSKQLPHFPKYISLALSRPFERHLSTYLELGKMYMGANWTKVLEIAGNKLFREVRSFTRNLFGLCS